MPRVSYGPGSVFSGCPGSFFGYGENDFWMPRGVFGDRGMLLKYPVSFLGQGFLLRGSRSKKKYIRLELTLQRRHV